MGCRGQGGAQACVPGGSGEHRVRLPDFLFQRTGPAAVGEETGGQGGGGRTRGAVVWVPGVRPWCGTGKVRVEA